MVTYSLSIPLSAVTKICNYVCKALLSALTICLYITIAHNLFLKTIDDMVNPT